MKKKRGLSYDEKRQKMLKIFHQTQSVFNYDEIEKLSVKAGIPFPTVKEILKSLQADNFVQCQKIGAGVFYWSFPSRAMQIYETKIATSKKQIAYYEEQLSYIAEEWQRNQAGRQQTEQRQNLVQQLSFLKKGEQELEKQIKKYIRFDPQRIALLSKRFKYSEKQNNELKSAINAQTDNIEQIKKFIKKQQPGTKDKQIEQMYQIPADLQYID